MPLRLVILGLFLLVSILLWWPAFQNPSQTPDESDMEIVPDFTAKMLHQELFNADGELSQEVFSQSMEHYAELSLTHFVRPEFIIYQDKQPFWRMSAKIGDIQDGVLTLDQEVKMVQLSDNKMVKFITTEFLEINLETNKVTTDNPIKIEGEKLTILGQGLEADLTLGKVSLTKHVETHFKGIK